MTSSSKATRAAAPIARSMTPLRPRIGSDALFPGTGACATCCDEFGGGGGVGVRIIVTDQGPDDWLGVERLISFKAPSVDTVMSLEVEFVGCGDVRFDSGDGRAVMLPADGVETALEPGECDRFVPHEIASTDIKMNASAFAALPRNMGVGESNERTRLNELSSIPRAMPRPDRHGRPVVRECSSPRQLSSRAQRRRQPMLAHPRFEPRIAIHA